ncbi:hypothetical protein JOC86_003229 [Bacillus pakistanensis]|uniref:Uncharacterized protein n=1 Tax=Rossellomorea pakistanensis TaxID=992288 RepID=A0ABS2NFR6_9BACI|nr:hypothetical protein [Bacillus pakistanensis]
MKQVMSSSRKKDIRQQKLAILRLEMDYELAVLFEALQDENQEVQKKSKDKLTKIRDELVKLQAL